MKLLLDTQVWLWMVTAPERLRAPARRALVDERNTLLLSAATPWEVAIKVATGKLRLPSPIEDFVAQHALATRVTPLPIQQLHAMESAALPAHHRDPFDRVLVAQARLEDAVLVTSDRVFRLYGISLLQAA